MIPAANENRIDYVELPAAETAAAKQFYSAAFGWKWRDFGPDYADTNDGRLGAGINAGNDHRTKAPLVIVFALDLEAACERVRKAGGRITQEIFSFPGGRRFHFADPAGNELGVYSDR
jgi:predicted enzyme related to lactoylglutathione lyase